MRIAVVALLCALSAFGQSSGAAGSKSALDKTTFETYIRHLLAVLPEVQIKVDDPAPSPVAELRQVTVHFTYGNRSQEETFFVSKDGKEILRGIAYNVNVNPFQADLSKLKTDLAPSFGTPGAPVVIVAFDDFQCPNCREEALSIRTNLEKTFPGQVRFYFKNFPLEQLHNWAKPAAIAGRCIFRQEPAAFWKYHDWVYQTQGEINSDNFHDKLTEFAKENNLDGVQLAQCVDNKKTEADVDKDVAEGHALAIDATPTVFINGRRLVGSYPWQNLEQIIRTELNYQKATSDAGEKCCEVSIPNPLKK